MRILIDCYAMKDDYKYDTIGKASINLDVPDNIKAFALGDTVYMAVYQAIVLHRAKLAELKAEQEQVAPEQEKPE